jgi:hypothetical protein
MLKLDNILQGTTAILSLLAVYKQDHDKTMPFHSAGFLHPGSVCCDREPNTKNEPASARLPIQ